MTSPKPDDLRDPRLDAAWRHFSHEEAPAALSEAVRAAARREVGAGPLRAGSARRAPRVPDATRPQRWWWPLAAAATIGAIAFGLLQLKPAENGGPSVVSDMPATPTKRAAAPPQAAPSEQAAPRATAPASPARQDATPKVKPGPAPAAPVRAEVPSVAKTEQSSAPVEGTREQAAAPGLGKLAASPSPAARPESAAFAARDAAPANAAAGAKVEVRSVEMRAREGARLPVAEWIARIRRLRDEGQIDEAAQELAAFRVAYPDHEQRLPADLRDWRFSGK